MCPLEIQRETWMVIRYQYGTDPDYWVGPALVAVREFEENTAYWSTGLSHMPLNWKRVEVLKEYDEIIRDGSSQYYHEVDDIQNQYALDYPPESAIKVSAGWLAPDGKFYPCRYMEHLNLAYHLAYVHYRDDDNGEKRLEQEGWAKIYSDGKILPLGSYAMDGDLNILYPDIKYTQKQLNTLLDLYNLAVKEGTTDYANKILREIEENNGHE